MPKVLITGATSGIGLALVHLYAKQAFTVIACGRNHTVLSELSEQYPNVSTLCFDINDKSAVLKSADEIQGLTHLILNAGSCEYINDAYHFDSSLFERVIHTNLIAMGYCLEAFLPKLQATGHLAIMSSSATFLPLTRSEAYGASKAGVTYLARCLSIDLAKHNIAVSVIHPGFVKTPLTDKNTFEMPLKISAQAAANIIYQGIKKRKHEIHFPRKFTYLLKMLSLLPFALWRKLAIRMT